MTLTLDRPTIDLGTGDGGVAARRAVVRWAWRLLRREWRQQLLVLALITVAVAATVVGAGVAVNTPTSRQAGFGSANAMLQLPGSSPSLATHLAALERTVGEVDVISQETLPIPGSINTFVLRAENPLGRYDRALVSVVHGRLPTAPDEVALTATLASDFGVHVGGVWQLGGTTRHVVGIVQDPLDTLDTFALVPPGQIGSAGQVTLLFDATDAQLDQLGLSDQAQRPPSTFNGGFNPEIFVILISTLGMLLIGLVAVGGFTVLAQRRMRSIGMLGAVGATDKDIRLVVQANGLAVGIVGTILGAGLGVAGWLAYRPRVEAASHHLVGALALPWVVILPAMALAVVTAWFAASRPARAVTRVPIVTALSGRPAPPRPVHRSATRGVIVTGAAYLLLLYAGQSKGNGGGAPELVFGFVALAVGIILLAPLAVASVAKISGRAPVAVRLALRDLARYRSRSGSALAAVGLSVLLAATVCVAAAARYGNPLDYAGPNLTNTEMIVYTPGNAPTPQSTPAVQASPSALEAEASSIAVALGSHQVLALQAPDANLSHNGPGRQFSGQLYVATPQLLAAFGISPSEVDPNADVLTMRPGLATVSNMQLQYGDGGGLSKGGPGPSGSEGQVQPGSGGGLIQQGPQQSTLNNPIIQTVTALPSGTSAPNTVITEHAVRRLGLQTSVAGWLITTAHPLTASQISAAGQAAATVGMSIETKSDSPSSTQVIDWATVAGIALALAILAMTVGLIRSETAGDLRTLAATGASSRTRRTLTAATAAALGLVGAVVGTAAAYLACLAFYSGSPNGDGIGELANIPLANLAIILVGMPFVAGVCGWLFAGRDPALMSRQPME